MEDGVSPAALSRATGITVENLMSLPVARRASVPSSEELAVKAAQLAERALDEGHRMLSEGSQALKVRLIASLTAHPMRRMQTDQGAQVSAMRRALDQLLLGNLEQAKELLGPPSPADIEEDGTRDPS